MKKLLAIISASLLILAACSTTPTTVTKVYSGILTLASPTENAQITSPVTITGTAQGSMYFEGTFPVSITDSNDVELGKGQAKAQSDWMTTNFVPFQATITFTTPSTATGFIVFKNDNPSGLPANEITIKIPITF